MKTKVKYTFTKSVRHKIYKSALKKLPYAVKCGNGICCAIGLCQESVSINYNFNGLYDKLDKDFPEVFQQKPSTIYDEDYRYWFKVGEYKKRESILKKCIQLTKPKNK